MRCLIFYYLFISLHSLEIRYEITRRLTHKNILLLIDLYRRYQRISNECRFNTELIKRDEYNTEKNTKVGPKQQNYKWYRLGIIEPVHRR